MTKKEKKGVFRTLFNTTNRYTKRSFEVIGVLSAILSTLALFILNENLAIWAFAIFCVGTFIIVFSIARLLLKNYEKLHTDDYIRTTSFITHDFATKHISTYEVIQHIQCKTILLDRIYYKFKWTGSKQPVVSSDMQTVGPVFINDSPDEFDQVELRLDRPLRYGETVVQHFRAQLDDSDEKAKTMLAFHVEKPIEVLRMVAILRYKIDTYDKKAVVYVRMKAGASSQERKIEEIKFDQKTKSYLFHQKQPLIGRVYRMAWER